MAGPVEASNWNRTRFAKRVGLEYPIVKAHLSRYLGQIVRLPYDTNMIGYLDMVGKMHTPMAGSRELDVRLVQMNTLLGPGRFWTPARIA